MFLLKLGKYLIVFATSVLLNYTGLLHCIPQPVNHLNSFAQKDFKQIHKIYKLCVLLIQLEREQNTLHANKPFLSHNYYDGAGGGKTRIRPFSCRASVIFKRGT